MCYQLKKESSCIIWAFWFIYLFRTGLTLVVSHMLTHRLFVLLSIMNFDEAAISDQVVVLVCLEESQEMDETPEGISLSIH